MDRPRWAAILMAVALACLPSASAGTLTDLVDSGGPSTNGPTIKVACTYERTEENGTVTTTEDCDGYVAVDEDGGVSVCTRRVESRTENATTGEVETDYQASCLLGDGGPPVPGLLRPMLD